MGGAVHELVLFRGDVLAGGCCCPGGCAAWVWRVLSRGVVLFRGGGGAIQGVVLFITGSDIIKPSFSPCGQNNRHTLLKILQ